jgi:ubiquinone/menaquinone biosynthesis C-methylase UbiE
VIRPWRRGGAPAVVAGGIFGLYNPAVHAGRPMTKSNIETLREAECELVIAELRARNMDGASVVEIGGGTGWQARRLAEAGYTVRSFDIASSDYRDDRVYPVEDYDGRTIPAADASFDVAYSSNVLEHIAALEEFQAELARVLKPGGIAIHIVPSATWRTYTFLAHYPWLLRMAVNLARGKRDTPEARIAVRAATRRSPLQLASRTLVAPRHGERGTALGEMWLFSRFAWLELVQRTGWRLLARKPNALVYTGAELFGRHLDLTARRRLSRIFGSSCHVFVLAPPAGS